MNTSPEAAGADFQARTGERLRSSRGSLRPLRSLLPVVQRHWPDAVWAGVFLLASTSATFAITFAVRSLADRGIALHSLSAINTEFLRLGVAVVALALATAGRFYFINKLGERVVADLRIAVFCQVIAQDQSWFGITTVGDVISRLTNDLTIVENMVGSSVAVAIRNLLILFFGLVLLVHINPAFTGLVIVLAGLSVVPLLVLGMRVRRLSFAAQTRFSDALQYAGETLQAVDTVQAFGREQTAKDRFTSIVETAFRASSARVRARTVMTGGAMILVATGVGLVLWRASAAAFVTHPVTAGALLQFVFVSVLTAGAVGSLGEAWGDVEKTAGAMGRIGELLEARPAVVAPKNATRLPRPSRGEVTFEGVGFAYPGRPDSAVLADFNLDVRAGERVALVGPSGAGKTTVFRLLLRFYDPQSGAVRIDGVKIVDADPAEVRRRLAWVAQDAPLFSGTVLENLRFATDEVDEAELISAARAAQAEGFVSAMPMGFATQLGERGNALSGGERQRIAIARAVARNAPILLLDEATSALDAENESAVQRALEEAMRGRTTLVIAHRLATVMKAHRIVVIDRGRVVDEGVHSELVARGGLYARLAALQFGALEV